jgi:hypothetical protein
MKREMALASKQERTPENLLWRAVIATAIQDWFSSSLSLKREAERYLFKDSPGLSFVCESAGMDVAKLRARLNKLRGQPMPGLVTVAA